MRKYDQTSEIVLFIEKLRSLRNITQEDFLHDIVSLRQYRRYISGDSTISYSILEQLAKRLGFEANFIITELESEKINQTTQVNDLYNFVVNKKFDKVNELLTKIDEKHLISNNDKLLYLHSINKLDFLKGNSSELITINKTKKLFDYENLLKKRVLSTSELLGLISFFKYDSFKDKNVIAKVLASFLDNNITIVSGNNIRVVALTLAELSRYFSIIEDYTNMYYYANEGIKYSKKVRSSYILDALYYLSAAALDELGRYDERDEYIFKCLNYLLLEGNKNKYIHYTNLFKEYFKVDSESLIINKLENFINK